MLKLMMVIVTGSILLSCNNKPADGNASDATKVILDTPATVSAAPRRVKGPAGFLYVDDGGNGDIPVVFTHSFGGSTAHWKNQLQHLRTSRRAIAFDFRGHGQSDLPSVNNSYTIEALSTDIDAVVNELGLQRFILVGHSMGGSAAIAYSAAHPEHVAGLVLAGTPGKTDPKQATQVLSALESDAYQKVMDDYTHQQLNGAQPGVDTLVQNGYGKIPKAPSIGLIKAGFDFDPLPSLQKYKGPLLIVAASSESKQPNALSSQLRNIPHTTIPNTSHWMQLDNPNEFNKVLDKFLQGIK